MLCEIHIWKQNAVQSVRRIISCHMLPRNCIAFLSYISDPWWKWPQRWIFTNFPQCMLVKNWTIGKMWRFLCKNIN